MSGPEAQLERVGVARWTVSFGAVLATHALLAWTYLHPQPPDALPGGAAVLVDMEPLPVAPQQETAESTPGPEQTQTAEAPAEPEKVEPEPEREPEPDPVQTAELPPQPEPPPEPVAKVEPELPVPPAPPEVVPDVAMAPPDPPKPPPKPQPKPEKPVEKRETPKPKPKPTVTATTAPSAAASVAPRAAASSADVGRNVSMPSWRASIAAHLQRHKRYPADAQARGEAGTATLTFSIDRNGHVLSSSLRGSGLPSLDQETLALIRRAQPLPAAPADVVGNRFSFSVPIRYSLR